MIDFKNVQWKPEIKMFIVGWFGHCKCLLHECTFSSGTINKQLCTQSGLWGKKENWEGSQFPTCKQEIDQLSQLSDPSAKCIRLHDFIKKKKSRLFCDRGDVHITGKFEVH